MDLPVIAARGDTASIGGPGHGFDKIGEAAGVAEVGEDGLPG
jgi:hypothetical protein